ncbi:Oidioi.mRNA.OKI2018_I69.XSR.g14379.t1.cds [Oikopleura dioica]|uniref:Oidioi.mRNA.OKI2018_I69.XSR.g14379.t1.cds n=1 Tax=Oikopleura dioica TaxID=34765 RepID=A0ABN7S9P3_OIKDI|nr:Oidioi.mRNA.OKI2018_I69.XSR.g14379.t1.cds [Oikopleura dioica]
MEKNLSMILDSIFAVDLRKLDSKEATFVRQMRAIATGHSETLPWIVRDIEYDIISKEDMKYSDMSDFWMKHPKYKELDRCLGDTRPSSYSSTSTDDALKTSLCQFFEENSDLDTRVRSEVQVLGQIKRKRYLRKPFWILLKQYKAEKGPECCLNTLRKIYKKHFSSWLSLPDDESILRCVCPSHLQVELFCKAINRVSMRPAISEEQLLDTTVCENGGHAVRCLENACSTCDDSEDGYALARARLELLMELVPDDADVTYAQLCEIEKVDANNNRYKREQILMQCAPKVEFLDLLTDYLLRGCMSSGAQKKLLNHYKLNEECYNFSRSLLDICTYDNDALMITTDYVDLEALEYLIGRFTGLLRTFLEDSKALEYLTGRFTGLVRTISDDLEALDCLIGRFTGLVRTISDDLEALECLKGRFTGLVRTIPDDLEALEYLTGRF